MTTYFESYALAAGLNVSLGSLVNIESITPSADEPFGGPKSIPLYLKGVRKNRLDRMVYPVGSQVVKWMFTRLTYAQYAYLSTTYCSGSLSGNVTIYTTLGSATYYRMNAVMQLPDPMSLHGEFGRYKDAEVVFVILGAAS